MSPARTSTWMISWGVHWSARTQLHTAAAAASAAPVLGRTHLGSFPPCEDQPYVERLRSPPYFFGRITEQLEVPNLLAIQTESFDWLVGNEAWQARSTDDPHAHSGLAEILEEISPIEDFSGTMSLSFSSPRFDEVKASIEECKEK